MKAGTPYVHKNQFLLGFLVCKAVRLTLELRCPLLYALQPNKLQAEFRLTIAQADVIKAVWLDIYPRLVPTHAKVIMNNRPKLSSRKMSMKVL